MKASGPSWKGTPRYSLGLALWLHQQGRGRPDSDVDLAVLASEELTLSDYLKLQEELQQALGVDPVDLCVLNRADAIVQFEAIRGTRLVCRDPEGHASFVSLVSRRYEEAMAMLAAGFRYWREARATV